MDSLNPTPQHKPYLYEPGNNSINPWSRLTCHESRGYPDVYAGLNNEAFGLNLTSARILVVDDQEANVALMELMLLQAGYQQIHTTTDPVQVLYLYNSFHPDLIILDLHMPHMDGYAVLKQLSTRIPDDTYLPILILTADVSSKAKEKALSMGAKDFLIKPFETTEALLRIRNLLETRFLQQQLKEQNHILEEKVQERTQELEEAQLEILDRLALAAEFRDDATGQHTQRVGWMSALIAEELGWPKLEVERIRRSAPLHDIGKIGVSDHILLKNGKLADDEYEQMKMHISIGVKILSGSRFAILQMAEEIAFSHHLRWDGTGYPDGIAGVDIPMVGRIVAVADVFDALTHERPYKEAWPVEMALQEIQSQSGIQFDPKVVDAFMRVSEQSNLLEIEGSISSGSDSLMKLPDLLTDEA